MSPQRIQLKRTKGWRKPEGTVVVARPSRWGNPFTIEAAIEAGMIESWTDPIDQRRFVVDVFADWLTNGPNSDWWYLNGQDLFVRMTADIGELKGKDVACWCPLDHPCHGDVLIDHQIRARGLPDSSGRGIALQ